MIDKKEITRIETELGKLLAEKHGLKDGPLEQRLRKALRRSPRRIRRAAEGVVRAQMQMGSPKLMRQLEPEALNRDFRILLNHFKAIDVADRRKGMILGMLGGLSFNLLAAFALLLFLLLWRGFL